MPSDAAFAQRMMRNTITPTNIDQLLHEEGVVVEEINAEITAVRNKK